MPGKRNTRRRRRRRRGGLGALVRPLSVLLAAVAIVAALTLFFKVESVEVTGNVRYTASQIVAASGVEDGDNLILFDKYGTSQRIYTQLPYITAVRINRRLPSTLLVEVTETQAAAAVQSENGWWMLGLSAGSGGPELKVLEGLDSAPDGCLRLEGLPLGEIQVGRSLRLAEESPLDSRRLAELLLAMEEKGVLADMERADFSDGEQITLGYAGRFTVELFYDANFDFKMNCLTEAVAQLQPNERGTIRMTMSDDNEVRFIPESGQPAPAPEADGGADAGGGTAPDEA